ncbi:MAG: hypothetical protein JXA96_07770 [Sedimentisphaerales bacterium]|nr:hypothetical protein [Sedimentisphaerales bacterium]
MRPSDKNLHNVIKKMFFKASPELDKNIWLETLQTHNEFHGKENESGKINVWRIAMKNNIIKIATAAVIIIGILLAIHYSGGSIDVSGVVWADVLKKIENSRGLILRVTEIPSGDYSILYKTPEYSRSDYYAEGQLVRTFYDNHDLMIATSVWYDSKRYMSHQYTPNDGFMEQPEHWLNPMYLINQILSCNYRKLEPTIIEGVLCEGIETTDPNLILNTVTEEMMEEEGSKEFVDSLELHMKLWVDSKTQYPVMLEWKTKAVIFEKALINESVSKQFQWDVDIDPSIFEPNIPSDYRDIAPRALRQ